MRAQGGPLETFPERGANVRGVIDELKQLKIETPSWGYGNTGTRFQVFPWPGAARTIWEKLDDAALVHQLTGVCPTVATHIPWDSVADFHKLAVYATDRGLRIGAVNPNLFQADAYRLGSVCHPDPQVRRTAVEHLRECIQIAGQVGSNLISLWLADGTNYPGQDDVRARKHRLAETLSEVLSAMPAGMRLLIEYKFFEPAFYHTDVADWGMAFALATRLGPQAEVLVDLGHHPPGTNIEHIVAFLLDEGRLGGFHFNNRKYADDDLIVGSTNPFELFMIFHEIVRAAVGADARVAACARRIAYMIDQSHNIEGKIEPMLQAVTNVQLAYAKALLVDRRALADSQQAGDVLGAHRILLQAYETDVRPMLVAVRDELGVPRDPIGAFRQQGHAERLARQRGAQAREGGYHGGG